MHHRILIVEDDPELGHLLKDFLSKEGFLITIAQDGITGEQLALEQSFDVIVLDIMLPKKNGLSVLQTLRPQIKTPFLMLTARGDETDRIIGFEMGADDYLPKPFNPRELVVRLKAILRRVSLENKFEGVKRLLEVNDLTLNCATREVFKEGKGIELTGAEFNVLLILVENANSIVSKEVLCEQALGRKLTLHDRAVDMHMSNVRRKIGGSWIKTVRGAGYLYQDKGQVT